MPNLCLVLTCHLNKCLYDNKCTRLDAQGDLNKIVFYNSTISNYKTYLLDYNYKDACFSGLEYYIDVAQKYVYIYDSWDHSWCRQSKKKLESEYL